MGLHSPCKHAYNCKWGSETVPGTCGFTRCMKNNYINRAERGDSCALEILRESQELTPSLEREIGEASQRHQENIDFLRGKHYYDD